MFQRGCCGYSVVSMAEATPRSAFFHVAERSETEVRLVCSGSLDFDARATLRDAVARLLDEQTGDRKVVLDLRGMSIIDSAGLAGLVAALRVCEDRAPSWELMPSAPVRRILALVGLGRIKSGESGGWLAGDGYGND